MPTYSSNNGRNSIIFTSSSVFIAPPNVSLVYVTIVGGGGGGSTLSGSEPARGGGGGAAIIAAPFYLGAAEVVPITIGAGGQSDLAPGENGGTTFFGSYIYAEGGYGTGEGGGILGYPGKSPGAGADSQIVSSQSIISGELRYTGYMVGCAGGDASINIAGSVLSPDGQSTINVGGLTTAGSGASLFGVGVDGDGNGKGYGAGGAGNGSGSSGICIISWD